MYNIWCTGVVTSLLYIISYLLYKNGVYSKLLHQRLWNIILAVVFLTTAIAGLLLALQANYKWDLNNVRTLFKWHVEFGISMTFTGLFHLIWHFSFFIKIFKKNGKAIAEPAGKELLLKDLAVNLFIVGFMSSSLQLLLMKEIMNISGGYELISGTFLGSWLIGSAAGSTLARNSSLSDQRRINILFAAAPFVSVMLLIFLARIFLEPGETPSFLLSVIYTFLVVVPYCIISGFAFVKLISLAGRGNNSLPGNYFAIETTGGIIAGIVVSILGSGIINTYQMILIILIMGSLYAFLTFCIKSGTKALLIKIISLVILIIVITGTPDRFFRQLLLRGMKVTESTDTPYGNVTKAEYKGEVSTYYNQRLLKYTSDAIEREEDVHYALLQCERPENVLMISGSVDSHLPEIIKYDVERSVYVERDQALVEAGRNIPAGLKDKVIIETGDAYRFVKKTNRKFDAVLILLPPPSNLLLNRYYTTEFFGHVKEILNEGGVVSCSPGINPNYLNKESINLCSSIFNSMAEVFHNVVPVAGNKIYFIASDKDLSLSFCDLSTRKGLQNVYVGPDYLSDDLTTAKSNELYSLIDRETRINRSGMPAAVFYYQSFNLTRDMRDKLPYAFLILGALLLSIFVLKKGSLVMYLSASSLAGFEIILLLILQLTLGNMYQFTGLIIGGLMAGLAAGAASNIRIPGNLSVRLKTGLLVLFYLLMTLMIPHLPQTDTGVSILALLILLAFIPGFLTGSLFRDLTKNETGLKDTAGIYSSDLAGSGAGFFLFTAVALPLAGILTSLIILAAMNLAGFLIITLRKR